MKWLWYITPLALIVYVALFNYAREDGLGGAKPLFNDQGAEVYTDCDLTKPKVPNVAHALDTLRTKANDNALRALDATERASFKGCEIAKIKNVPRQRVQFSGADYDIEIVEMKPIEGGVEVFARAWTGNSPVDVTTLGEPRPDGSGDLVLLRTIPAHTQIGFGVDGSVDIERFRIFNPPILVSDPQGNIVREQYDEILEATTTHRWREDVLAATTYSLAHTISIKKERFTDRAIQPGKRGNTTSTFYPNADADAGKTSGDGRTRRAATNQAWATIRAGAGSNATDVTNPDIILGYAFGRTGTTWDELARGIITFDTASIPDTDTISSATFSVYGTAVYTTAGQSISLSTSTPASNTDIVAADFTQVGLTRLATDIALTSFSVVGYNDFALNATGVSIIMKTGVTRFGTRLSGDMDNVQPAGVGVDSDIGSQCYTADQTGTANDPKLVVEHSGGAPAPALPSDDIIFY